MLYIGRTRLEECPDGLEDNHGHAKRVFTKKSKKIGREDVVVEKPTSSMPRPNTNARRNPQDKRRLVGFGAFGGRFDLR